MDISLILYLRPPSLQHGLWLQVTSSERGLFASVVHYGRRAMMSSLTPYGPRRSPESVLPSGPLFILMSEMFTGDRRRIVNSCEPSPPHPEGGADDAVKVVGLIPGRVSASHHRQTHQHCSTTCMCVCVFSTLWFHTRSISVSTHTHSSGPQEVQ